MLDDQHCEIDPSDEESSDTQIEVIEDQAFWGDAVCFTYFLLIENFMIQNVIAYQTKVQ